MEQQHPDRPPDSIVPDDFYGMSADEIIEVHRAVFGTESSPAVAVEEIGGSLMPHRTLLNLFSDCLDRLCIDHPAEATEVLAKLSLSECEDERDTSAAFLRSLAVGNTAAAMTMLEEALSGEDKGAARSALSALEEADDEGTLSLDQVAYLLGRYYINPYRF